MNLPNLANTPQNIIIRIASLRLVNAYIKKNQFISVSNFLSTDFLTVRSDESIIDIIKKLLQLELNSAIVIENNSRNDDAPIGMIKTKDLLRKIIKTYEKNNESTLQLKKISAKDVMSVPLIYAFLDQSIWDALDLMCSKNIGVLPVLDSSDKIHGVIRMTSILKNLSEL